MEPLSKNSLIDDQKRSHIQWVTLKDREGVDFKSKKNQPAISFSILQTKIGKLIVASTPKGICYVGYIEKGETFVEQLHKRFPYSKIRNKKNKMHLLIQALFKKDFDHQIKIPLHLKGTPFQRKVWEALLEIPFGTITTYGDIAAKVGKPKAQRAVGNAIGKNPVLFVIPCHRVITSSGKLGGFYWGIDKKVFLLNRECNPKKTKGVNTWEPTFF